MSKVDYRLSRSVFVNGFNVSIGLNLNPVPAQWDFLLSQGGTAYTVRVEGIENPLTIPAPIESSEKRQIHEWLRSFKIKDLPHWTLYRDILVKIVELKQQEIQSRENHEEVKKIMVQAKSNSNPQ